ncbi:MAG: tryptophan-rich sensory protein [Fimbriimonadales bacterium]|nr:tryptophan-rich sensory protein [Fimbriimonadales bacterium]
MGSAVAWLGFVGASFLAGAIGGAATGPAIAPWYAGLAKPAWNPPNWVFGPVWTILYASMGSAAWLAWRAGAKPSAFVLFGVQLLLNALWSVLFFGLRRPDLAFFEILALFAAIVACAAAFSAASRAAAWLMVPYAAWVAFAAALNLAIWRLNA